MKNINESGRSMVEMLGVLAIIGVLSIGGIAGYSMAMNRYRANEALDMANKFAVVVYSSYHTAQAMGNNSWSVPTLQSSGLTTDANTPGGASITYSSDANDDLNKGVVKLTIKFPTEAVCKAAQSILGIGSTTDNGNSGGTVSDQSSVNGNSEVATVAAGGIMTIAGNAASCTPIGCDGSNQIVYCFKQS